MATKLWLVVLVCEMSGLTMVSIWEDKLPGALSLGDAWCISIVRQPRQSVLALISKPKNCAKCVCVYSTGVRKVDTLRQSFGGWPQVKRRFYRHQEAFVIAGIPDFCSALLSVNRLQDNKSRK